MKKLKNDMRDCILMCVVIFMLYGVAVAFLIASFFSIDGWAQDTMSTVMKLITFSVPAFCLYVISAFRSYMRYERKMAFGRRRKQTDARKRNRV